MPRKNQPKKQVKPTAKKGSAKVVSKPDKNPVVKVKVPTITPVGSPDAKGVFDALFEAQWGLPRDKRELMLGRLLGMVNEGSDGKCLEAVDRLTELQKLDVKVFESLVKGMGLALGQKTNEQPLPVLSDADLDERLEHLTHKVESEPIPMPIRKGQPRLAQQIEDMDEYEVAN